jgi:hypothetical protein
VPWLHYPSAPAKLELPTLAIRKNHVFLYIKPQLLTASWKNMDDFA